MSNDRHLWQIHSGPHWNVPQALQRCTSSSPRRVASQYGLSRPSLSGTGTGNPLGR